jgi:hypothetical protein
LYFPDGLFDLLFLIVVGIRAALTAQDHLTQGTDVRKLAMAAFAAVDPMPARMFQVCNEVSELSGHFPT